jgi:hypothetical protein
MLSAGVGSHPPGGIAPRRGNAQRCAGLRFPSGRAYDAAEQHSWRRAVAVRFAPGTWHPERLPTIGCFRRCLRTSESFLDCFVRLLRLARTMQRRCGDVVVLGLIERIVRELEAGTNDAALTAAGVSHPLALIGFARSHPMDRKSAPISSREECKC